MDHTTAPITHHPFSLTHLRNLAYLYAARFQARRAWEAKLAGPDAPRLPDGVKHERLEVPSRQEGRAIIVDKYWSEKEGETVGPRAVHLNWHGSGFIVPRLGTDKEACGRWAAETGAVVLDCDYRKAPEYPYPAAPQDALDALAYVLAHTDLYDPSRVTLSGFSAGANLAMVVAVTHNAAALDPSPKPGSPHSPIRALASIYGNPYINTPCPPAPSAEFDDGATVPAAYRAWFYSCYILPGQDRSAIGLSPGLAPAQHWPARVLVACGEADDVYGLGKKLVDKLQAEGHHGAEFVGIERSAHGFDKVGNGEGTRAKKEKLYAQVAGMIREATR